MLHHTAVCMEEVVSEVFTLEGVRKSGTKLILIAFHNFAIRPSIFIHIWDPAKLGL